jgi:Putative metallopeptidase
MLMVNWKRRRMLALSMRQWWWGLLVAASGLVLLSGCGGGTSQEEEGEETTAETATTGQVEVIYEDDAIKPENQDAVEQLRQSGALERLADWINERVALSHDMEVRVTDDVPEGVTDQSTQADGRTIFIPGSWLTETHGIVAEMVEDINRPAVFPEEKFNADDLNVLANQYIFGHEMGHALMRNLMLPVTGFEEDSADGFASFYNVNEEGPDPVIAAAMFFDELARQQGDPTMEQFASDHPITQQRVYNFLCLLEGSDPENLHGPLVYEGYLPESRAPLCPMEWAWLNYGWWTVLEPHFSEGFSEQGTEAQEQAREQYIAENEAIEEVIAKIRTGKA